MVASVFHSVQVFSFMFTGAGGGIYRMVLLHVCWRTVGSLPRYVYSAYLFFGSMAGLSYRRRLVDAGLTFPWTCKCLQILSKITATHTHTLQPLHNTFGNVNKMSTLHSGSQQYIAKCTKPHNAAFVKQHIASSNVQIVQLRPKTRWTDSSWYLISATQSLQSGPRAPRSNQKG